MVILSLNVLLQSSVRVCSFSSMQMYNFTATADQKSSFSEPSGSSLLGLSSILKSQDRLLDLLAGLRDLLAGLLDLLAGLLDLPLCESRLRGCGDRERDRRSLLTVTFRKGDLVLERDRCLTGERLRLWARSSLRSSIRSSRRSSLRSSLRSSYRSASLFGEALRSSLLGESLLASLLVGESLQTCLIGSFLLSSYRLGRSFQASPLQLGSRTSGNSYWASTVLPRFHLGFWSLTRS